jgi:hypothetical protein
MDPMAQKVAPEEKPIIENIISLFQQLLQMQDSAPVVDEVVTEALGETENMEEVDVAKSAEGETGDDNAEHRLNEVTPTTDESLGELKKSIDMLCSKLTPNKSVKKSAPVNSNIPALNAIAKTLTQLVEKQDSQDKLNVQLFEALGVTDEVFKSVASTQKEAVQKPVQGNDIALFAKEFADQIKKSMGVEKNPEAQNSWNDKKTARSGLFDVAKALHNGQRIGG